MTLATIDVSDLLGHPGASREQTLTGTLDGLATEVARVPDDAPIEVDLLLESVIEGILVSGRLRGTFSLTCSRCLTTFEAPFDVDVQGLCEVCGGNRNLGECPGHEDVDPRFSVLSGLFPEDTEPTDD
jgi:uncharacterized metal-binding protein YceD (DUF177 family)